MTEKTIKELLLDYTGRKESLIELENKATVDMGFEIENSANYIEEEKKDLHEFTHVLEAVVLGNGKNEINLQPPNYSREIGALVINHTLRIKLPETYQELLISMNKDANEYKVGLIKSFSGKSELEYKLESLVREKLENQPNTLLQKFLLQNEKDISFFDRVNPFSWFNSNWNLRHNVLDTLRSIDFNPVVIGSWFDENLKQEVVKINQEIRKANNEYNNLISKPLEEFITNEEITERIKLALIIRGKIENSSVSLETKKPFTWEEMNYLDEQPYLTISGTSPDITVSELEKIEPQHLLDYAKGGIIFSIINGLDEKIAEKIDPVATFISKTVREAERIEAEIYKRESTRYQQDKPNHEVKNPIIKTGIRTVF
jgi:hypothetical protein